MGTVTCKAAFVQHFMAQLHVSLGHSLASCQPLTQVKGLVAVTSPTAVHLTVSGCERLALTVHYQTNNQYHSVRMLHIMICKSL